MSDDKKEIMSDDKSYISEDLDQRALTPRLQQYLDEHTLSQYSDTFSRLGYWSSDKICCLPSEEDANFVKLLNINLNLYRIKARTMINEIRRNDSKITETSMISNTNNTSHNKDVKIICNLISPEPVVENNEIDQDENEPAENTENNMDESNENTNQISSKNQHKKYFLELLSKYGTKMEYNIDEKVRFFIPEYIPDKYYDRVGTIQSKISDMKYKIIDEKSDIIHVVPLECILKFDKINNNISNNKNNNKMNKYGNCQIGSPTQCGICYNKMRKAKAKDIYTNVFDCDGRHYWKCDKKLSGNDIIYHCDNENWHKDEYDLCCDCIKKNNKYKFIEVASSNFKKRVSWNNWEEKFILKCNKQYKNRYDITQIQKCIEIAWKLSTYTQIKKKENERKAPWRTTHAVKNYLDKIERERNSNPTNNKKRKKYETRSSDSPSKRRRTS